MKILIVTLELAPFVQVSQAAQSVANLAKALRLLGHEVSVVAPRLPAYEEAGLMAARQLSPLVISGGREAILFEAQLPSGVSLSLVDVEGACFDAALPLDEQAEALGVFSDAVAALGVRRAEQGAPFDVIHAHDAGAGLSLLKIQSSGAGDLGKVLTVHDAVRSGEFSKEDGSKLGIPSERLNAQGFATGEGLCLLKGLASEADAIVTPSDSYARQLVAPEKFGALSRAFQSVTLVGIIEGVDHALYNPSTDPSLSSRYDAPNPANKGRNKSSVLAELGLELELSRPVVYCEDAPGGDSSMESVLKALPSLLRNDITLILSGSDRFAQEAKAASETFSGQVAWLPLPGASLRRRILAASDFYLSVQKRNPSGQTLMQAARYGTVPVAFAVDAVSDVVVDVDSELRTGTGILFASMTKRGLATALARAVAAYRSPQWKSLLMRVMRQDLAWDRAARRHVQIYGQVASAGRSSLDS